MKSNKRIIGIIALIVVVITITICAVAFISKKPEEHVSSNSYIVPSEPINEISQSASKELKDYSIHYDTEFGGIYVDISIADFNALGFKYGDSVNVDFTNGYQMKDLPYYNGYYVEYDEPLLVGYPGYDYIKLAINFGDDLWKIADVSDSDKCTITLNEAEKYLDTQKVRDIQYSDEQGDTPDEIFANFRSVNVGNLKENILYRGASPIDNKHNRAPVVDKLLLSSGIQFIIDLADSEEEARAFSNKENFDSPNYMCMLEDDKIALLDMDANFKSEAFSQKLVDGLTKASQHEGPYYIHCQEGKDRTGYVCMIVEALAGANYQEIVDDYMVTYDNYYGISLEKDAERYNIIKEQNIDKMLQFVVGDGVDYKTTDLQQSVEDYLLNRGMSADSLDALKIQIQKEA